MRRLLALAVAVLIYMASARLFLAAMGALVLADMIRTIRSQIKR